jgi:hypothetical protein
MPEVKYDPSAEFFGKLFIKELEDMENNMKEIINKKEPIGKPCTIPTCDYCFVNDTCGGLL